MFFEHRMGTVVSLSFGVFLLGALVALCALIGFAVIVLIAAPVLLGSVWISQRWPQMNVIAITWIVFCLFVWLLIAIF